MCIASMPQRIRHLKKPPLYKLLFWHIASDANCFRMANDGLVSHVLKCDTA